MSVIQTVCNVMREILVISAVKQDRWLFFVKISSEHPVWNLFCLSNCETCYKIWKLEIEKGFVILEIINSHKNLLVHIPIHDFFVLCCLWILSSLFMLKKRCCSAIYLIVCLPFKHLFILTANKRDFLLRKIGPV